MKTITESFKNIINIQKEMGYRMPDFLRDPISLEEINHVQNELNIVFNDQLKELYSVANGININYEIPCGLTGLIPIYNFLNINDAIDYYKSAMEFPDSFQNEEFNFKPENNLFPFLEDGAGNCYWVDLNYGSSNFNRIFWTNTFGQDPEYLFESLEIMFQVIELCYKDKLIFLDEDGYLDENYEEFHKIASRLNPKINYWKLKQRLTWAWQNCGTICKIDPVFSITSFTVTESTQLRSCRNFAKPLALAVIQTQNR